MVEMRIHITRVCLPAQANEIKQGWGLLGFLGGEWPARRSGVHQRLRGTGQKAVVYEEVFFNAQPRVTFFEITRPVIFNPVAQR